MASETISITVSPINKTAFSPEYPRIHLGPPAPSPDLQQRHLPLHYEPSVNAYEEITSYHGYLNLAS